MNHEARSALDNHAPLFAAPRGDIEVSFEFFPPKSDKMAETLWHAIETLAPLNPRFVSVTYGAGGSTRERTHATVERLVRETSLAPAAHLTCVGASRGEIDDIARSYWDSGVRHIVALRGDPSDGLPGVPGVGDKTEEKVEDKVDGLDFEVNYDTSLDDFGLAAAAGVSSGASFN